MSDFNFIINDGEQFESKKGSLFAANYLKVLLFEFNAVEDGVTNLLGPKEDRVVLQSKEGWIEEWPTFLGGWHTRKPPLHTLEPSSLIIPLSSSTPIQRKALPTGHSFFKLSS